jgi:hypothetical protein
MSLAELQSLARSWGGDVLVVHFNDPVWDLLDHAPFSAWLGVDHRLKLVYLTKEANLGEVIHEMGHVFATDRSPNFSEEYDFFGWEFVVAQKVNLVDEWIQSAGNYSVGGTDFAEFEELTVDEQSDLLEERVAHARQLGLIVGEEPVSVR